MDEPACEYAGGAKQHRCPARTCVSEVLQSSRWKTARTFNGVAVALVTAMKVDERDVEPLGTELPNVRYVHCTIDGLKGPFGRTEGHGLCLSLASPGVKRNPSSAPTRTHRPCAGAL
jgi:hypothetical protein